VIPSRPSRLHLPKFDNSPRTIFEYLLARFPQVGENVWRERISQRSVLLADGTAVREDSPYRHGITVFYRKEVLNEPPPLAEPVILHRDEEIIVIDKPHGIPVTPAGVFVKRSLFVHLQCTLDLPDLTPIHRLDRETAGLVLFTIKRSTRGLYHRLFAEGEIEREYRAVAHTCAASFETKRWRIESRLESGQPWYRQHVVTGRPNALTEIELLDARSCSATFRLIPLTGRKHQLRVHMNSIGFPIIGDPLYPTIREKEPGEPPLQLLARRLSFVDPLTRHPRNFVSKIPLTCWFDSTV
jgi:tRNA pseudouridine32 synthase/23S rRNA pseudouridine746 synthase